MWWKDKFVFHSESCPAHLLIAKKVLYSYTEAQTPAALCNSVSTEFKSDRVQSGSLQRLRWSPHLTEGNRESEVGPSHDVWVKGGNSECSRATVQKSCKLLHITVQPLKLKKETGLSSAPLKEKNVLFLKRNICPQSSALNWTWRILVVFSIFLEIVRKEWNDFLNRFRLTWAASRRRLFVLHTACYGRDTWRPPVLQTEAAYSF